MGTRRVKKATADSKKPNWYNYKGARQTVGKRTAREALRSHFGIQKYKEELENQL